MFSALTLTTDIAQEGRHVRRLVPKADLFRFFDDFVGGREQPASLFPVFHLNNNIPYRCIALVSNFMPRYWAIHCERIGDGYRMPCAGFVDCFQLSTAKCVNKVCGMLVTQMLCSGRESASQDADLIVLVELFTRLLAL